MGWPQSHRKRSREIHGGLPAGSVLRPAVEGLAMMVECQILRQNPGESPRWVNYQAEIPEGSTVLGLLHRIAQEDPSLAFTTHHCKLGICAGCLMVINGERKLACRTIVRSSPVRLEPLSGLPLIKDLVVDFLPLRKNRNESGRKDQRNALDLCDRHEP